MFSQCELGAVAFEAGRVVGDALGPQCVRKRRRRIYSARQATATVRSVDRRITRMRLTLLLLLLLLLLLMLMLNWPAIVFGAWKMLRRFSCNMRRY